MDLDLKQTSRTRESILAEIHKKTAIIYSLANIQEGLVVDIISLLKQENVYEFNIKKVVNTIKKNAELFREDLNKKYGKDTNLKLIFGEATDILEDDILKVLKEDLGVTVEYKHKNYTKT